MRDETSAGVYARSFVSYTSAMNRFTLHVLAVSVAIGGWAGAGHARQATGAISQASQTSPAAPTATPPATPPRARPPEQVAYDAAMALKEPAAKVDALRKVRVDFPKTGILGMVDASLLTLLVDTWPERITEIGEVFDRVVKAAPTASAETRLSMLQRPVTQLLDKKILLDRAEVAVEAAMAALDPVKFIETQIDQAKRMKQPEPTAAAALSRLQAAQGRGQELLGRIYAARGDARAETTLAAALKVNPTSAPVALLLAGIEATRGDDTAALDHYLLAALGSKLKPADDAAMTALLRKVRGNDADLDAALDKIYYTALPNPVTPGRWAPTPNRSNRLVLAEAFTGSACMPCVSESLAFQALLERYPENAVIALAYHVHIPGPDPMTTSGSAGRKIYYDVKGVPTFNVDGSLTKLGGGGREHTAEVYNDYVKAIDKALETPAGATMSIAASVAGDTIVVKANVSQIAPDAKDVKLHLVLAERTLRFSGENGIRFHEMVVRAMAGKDGAGLPVGDSAEYTFDLATIRTDIIDSLAAEIAKRRKAEAPPTTATATPREYRAEGRAMTNLDPSQLVVIAFLQDGRKSILQAVRVDLGKPHAPRVK